MAWYVHAFFSDRIEETPKFVLTDPSPEFGEQWRNQIRLAVRVDPLPNLEAARAEDSAPDVLPHFLSITSEYVASSEFKDIVEELEPGLHQFIPILIRNDRVSPAQETKYWIVNVLRPINAVLNGAAIARLVELGRIPSPAESRKAFGRNFNFVDKAAVAGCHLWRSYVGFSSDLYFSEELMRRIKEAKLDGLTPWRAIEVDQSE